MQAGMKTCKPHWNEFSHDKERLLFESEEILSKLQNLTIKENLGQKKSIILD